MTYIVLFVGAGARARLLTLATVLLGVGSVACATATPAETRSMLSDNFQRAVADDPTVTSALMAVDAPVFTDGPAVFLAGNDIAGAPLTARTPFLSASIGKLLIAQAIFRAAREGKLALDDRLSKHVAPQTLRGLPVTGGDAALDAITVDMLLTHRSGLPDYFSGVSSDGAPNIITLIVDEPERTWTRAQILAYTKAHFAPVGVPGERFAYADTNYDLLGLVLEGVYGHSFHEVVREHVLTPLEMSSTWYHAFENKPDGLGAIAPIFIGSVDVTGLPSMSVDQAGGGLYTTLGDLVRLVRAFVSGQPIGFDKLTKDATLDAMHAGIDVGKTAWRIRPGGVVIFLGLLPTLEGHSGASGAWAYYIAEHDTVLVGSVNQTKWQEKHVEFLLRDVVPVIAQTPKVESD